MNIRPLTSYDAEASTIGALLLNSNLVEDIYSIVTPIDFADIDLSEIYSVILNLKASDSAIDILTVSEKRKTLKSGNDTFLIVADIARNVPSYANALTYAKVVKERSEARKISALGDKIKSLACEAKPITETISEIQGLALSLDASSDEAEVVGMLDIIPKIIDNIDANFNGVGVKGLDTGLTDLDGIIQGLNPSDMIVLAGRPGAGKTTLGMNIAENVAVNQGKSVLVFSLEMSGDQLTSRLLSSVSEISGNDIRTGQAVGTPENAAKLTVGVNKLTDADIRICDKAALKVSRIRTIARFQHKIKPLHLIVIDYIGLIRPDIDKKNTNRNLELGEISRQIKALAKELNIPVIALAQLNRAIEKRVNGRPVMSDLRDSGEIEQDADLIVFVHREDNERGRNGLTLVDVVKSRHNKIDFCYVQHQGHYSRFVNAAYIPDDEPEPTTRKAKSFKDTFGKEARA